MAKNIPLDNVAHARAFIEKFGFGKKHVSIDQFDTFIIDRGLATDPGTSDVKDNAYKGFVQQRGAARRLLNIAGAWINGSSFQISVNGRGEGYTVDQWATNSNEFTKTLGDQVNTYVESRVANLKALRNKAEGLIEAYGDPDGELHNSLVMLSSMAAHGVTLKSKIIGHVTQYRIAYEEVVKGIENAMQERQNAEETEEA